MHEGTLRSSAKWMDFVDRLGDAMLIQAGSGGVHSQKQAQAPEVNHRFTFMRHSRVKLLVKHARGSDMALARKVDRLVPKREKKMDGGQNWPY